MYLLSAYSSSRNSSFCIIKSIARFLSTDGAISSSAPAIVSISLPSVSITLADDSAIGLPKNLSNKYLIPNAIPRAWSSDTYSTLNSPPSRFLTSLLLANTSRRSSTEGEDIISLKIPHAAAFISLLPYLIPSTTALNLPMSRASSATPITAPRDVGPTKRPLRLIESVITGAGSPVEKSSPFLIAVVSAIFLATFPGGVLCLALAASSSILPLRSASNPFISSSSWSGLLSFLSIAASSSIPLKASS